VEGMRHGIGKMKFHNGDRYEGEFEKNSFHGFGVYLWNTIIDEDNNIVTGRKYEGEWKDGKRHGRGIYHSGKGDTYSGSFINDLYEGTGTLKTAKGDYFEGQFIRGRPSGYIKISYANGDIYEGDILAGNYEGKGSLHYRSNLGSYVGNWECGKEHGRGERIYSDGSKYNGEFFEGEKEGEGMMFFANGDQYLGNWKRGHMSGKGVYQYKNGDSYEGGFLQGYRYGEGKYIYRDGGYYHGEYCNVQTDSLSTNPNPLPICDGKRHGTGVRVWTNGARYEGQWREDRMHGSGMLMTADGGKYEGHFYNGLRSGHGQEQIGNLLGNMYYCPLGNKHYGVGFCTYIGEYKQGLFHGYGETNCMSEQYYKGQWQCGKKHGMGEQYFIRKGEGGDENRLCIGGFDYLYRIKSYQGTYHEDVREGQGMITYTNGDTIEGNFQNGQPHGNMVYVFAATGKLRMAKYVRGERMEWIELKFKTPGTDNRKHSPDKKTDKKMLKGKSSKKLMIADLTK
jgi:hypothetical protein